MFATIFSPQIMTIPMGLISEAVPIFGSHTRSYIFLGALLQFSFGIVIVLAVT